MIDSLKTCNRLLLEAELQPIQGGRFQPTGFPDLGAAEFRLPGGPTSLVLESTQSVANHLEKAVWDGATRDLVGPLHGTPYVRFDHPEFGLLTSLSEPHRMASPYLRPLLEPRLGEELSRLGKGAPDQAGLARLMLRYDAGSLLHGVFFSRQKPRPLSLPRLLSGFIEAQEVGVVVSGGVKLDLLDPSGPSEEGKGHIPFGRTEYTSKRITAFFNFDLVQLRSYLLSSAAQDFLIQLALYKIRRFLDGGLRLRTACDLDVVSLRVTRPEALDLPEEEALETLLGESIARLTENGDFAQPAVWNLGD